MRAAVMLGLLVAAALAGCTGGANEGQLPIGAVGSETGTTSGSGDDGNGTVGPGSNATFDAYLEVSATNGTGPLNVTLSFGASASEPGEQENLTWTLEVRQPDGNATNGTGNGPGGNGTTGNGTGGSGNGSGNGTGSGNSTGNSTTGGTGGNSTGNSTGSGSATQTQTGTTSTGPGSNSTGNTTTGGTGGNATGNTTTGGTGGNATGNSTGGSGNGTAANGTSSHTVVYAFNGTGADLPGEESVWLNETASYEAVFTVRSGNETVVVRNATIDVTVLPPGSPLGNETQVFEGSLLANAPALCIGLGGSDEHTWVLNDTFAGTPAEVSRINLTLEDSSTVGEWTMSLVAPNGTEVASGSAIDAAGPFEAGNYTLTVESCGDVDAAYTVTAVADYVVAAMASRET